ncbi:hypothetical protein HPP92_005222 [Vanilla planifolia]|uniref:DUF7356 domain-containing protein n=1 Tax=Vanilla planifolia TaxID=51239 RepID=A0A835VEF2_VANPL|nr:hypothetical protein HPP92_005518 [Vanilla planifolia]KAG0494228.1 hypothetical protein HPP92_005222 [Vanilla planifolia]
MNGCIVLSLMLLLWIFVFIGGVATKDDLKGVLTTKASSSQAEDVSKAKNAPPGLAKEHGKEDKDEKSEREVKTSLVKDTEKNSGVRNDQTLEEPKAPGLLSKQSLEEGSNKKTQTNVDSEAKKTQTDVDSEAKGCDPSNRCVVKKSKLVACLRVPGTDAQALSLLIQNKGKETLEVKIIAPSFVNLVQTKLQINAKEDKELEVYVNEDSRSDSIVLQALQGNCSLDLRNVIPNTIGQNEMSMVARFFIRTSVRYTALLGVFLAAALVMILRSLYSRFRKSFPKYQKLEPGLPVSTGGKKEADDASDGWEGTWGNDWDEDETPMTPSKSIPNPSSKGLASRRLNKDGWKD